MVSPGAAMAFGHENQKISPRGHGGTKKIKNKKLLMGKSKYRFEFLIFSSVSPW
jgi:hypothetical protein